MCTLSVGPEIRLPSRDLHGMKPQRKPELDQVDVEALKSLFEQRGWRLYRLRLATTLEAKLRDLERPSDYKTVVELRAEIRTLRAVLSIPDILLAEAKTGAERQRESED